MAEVERTRVREREAPAKSSYEVAIEQDRAFAERQMTAKVVIRLEDRPQEQGRQGLLRYYLDRILDDTCLRNWVVFTHEVRKVSGKHKHQGGLVIYVIDGKGYSVVDGERIDWEKGDLLLLPMRPGGVEHQHFNEDPQKPATWMAFIHMPLREHVASEITQMEISPDFKQGGR
jgi:hypothetical protein